MHLLGVHKAENAGLEIFSKKTDSQWQNVLWKCCPVGITVPTQPNQPTYLDCTFLLGVRCLWAFQHCFGGKIWTSKVAVGNITSNKNSANSWNWLYQSSGILAQNIGTIQTRSQSSFDTPIVQARSASIVELFFAGKSVTFDYLFDTEQTYKHSKKFKFRKPRCFSCIDTLIVFWFS